MTKVQCTMPSDQGQETVSRRLGYLATKRQKPEGEPPSRRGFDCGRQRDHDSGHHLCLRGVLSEGRSGAEVGRLRKRLREGRLSGLDNLPWGRRGGYLRGYPRSRSRDGLAEPVLGPNLPGFVAR